MGGKVKWPLGRGRPRRVSRNSRCCVVYKIEGPCAQDQPASIELASRMDPWKKSETKEPKEPKKGDYNSPFHEKYRRPMRPRDASTHGAGETRYDVVTRTSGPRRDEFEIMG
jgi:hypothetical protein